MYYEVFIDVLFVINFVMDYFLLRLACRLLGHSATWLRSLEGAAIGAAGICLLAVFPMGRILNTILIHVVVNTIMVRFGCNLKKWREIAQGVLVLYGAGFLLGGMLLMLQRATGSRGVRAFFLRGHRQLYAPCGRHPGVFPGEEKAGPPPAGLAVREWEMSRRTRPVRHGKPVVGPGQQ